MASDLDLARELEYAAIKLGQATKECFFSHGGHLYFGDPNDDQKNIYASNLARRLFPTEGAGLLAENLNKMTASTRAENIRQWEERVREIKAKIAAV